MVLSTPSVAYTLMVTEPTISPRHLYVSVQAESVWYMSMYTDVHAHRISILCSFILSFLYKRVSFPVIVLNGITFNSHYFTCSLCYFVLTNLRSYAKAHVVSYLHFALDTSTSCIVIY